MEAAAMTASSQQLEKIAEALELAAANGGRHQYELCQEALALIPSLKAALQAMEWQDIATAPTKDEYGSFMVLCPGNDACSSLEVQVSIFEERMCPDHMDNLIDWGDAITSATHWRPKTPALQPPQGKEGV
jgi:hypothetical protein